MRPRRRAEIIGAGFAGLAAACALAQRGWQVRVHERSDQLRTTGAGIYIYAEWPACARGARRL